MQAKLVAKLVVWFGDLVAAVLRHRRAPRQRLHPP